MNILTSFLERVIRIRINGYINQNMSNTIFQGLHKARFYKPQALLIIINSPGGSVAQSLNISDILLNYSAKKNIPIYCFAEDQCLSSANIILTTGVKSYANSMSLIGDLGYVWNSLWFRKIAEKYQLSQIQLKGKPNEYSLNRYKQLNPKDQKWMQNYLYNLEHTLKVNLISNRQKVLEKLKIQKTTLQDNLLNKGILSAENAIKYGLIDDIMDCDQLIESKYNCKIYDIKADTTKISSSLLSLTNKLKLI